ncbi:hypothetical protein K431DRAFT_289895 [Polychaeton citri CBS 116435]|uniref:Uncharacterized protein n=1 Tax=Polychaeton citri CBS 116435 TaxID=1314669 RepID=A0A9P4PXW1_9PEZI|nr:hypothetical protein K431DRAFT_289895 [Polychaeton citri CBS 116435]
MGILLITNAAKGAPESTKENILETGAGLVQNFAPNKRLCAHLNAFSATVLSVPRGLSLATTARRILHPDANWKRWRALRCNQLCTQPLYTVMRVRPRSSPCDKGRS